MLIPGYLVVIECRVCVEAVLPKEVVFRLDCVACHDGCETVRRNLHVESVSFWAPANIGPYSQAVLVSVLPSIEHSVIENSQFVMTLLHYTCVFGAHHVNLNEVSPMQSVATCIPG